MDEATQVGVDGATFGHDMISTERLDLVLLSVEEVLTYADVAPGADLLADKPFANPHGLLVDDVGPLHYRIRQVRADPSVNPWLVHVMVERSSNTAIGFVNFHDRPDANGMVEIGYRVVPPRRRQGFALEATLGMFQWALLDSHVWTFRASVSPGNVASRNLVEGLGLIEVGLQEDPDDGPEIIYEIAAAEFAARFS
jgi:ribosomal-protein-alanine N-acetyltransferase